jgi:hypothetical protein
LEPSAYLRHVFTELPRAESVEAIEALLPWRCAEVVKGAAETPVETAATA